MRIVNVEFRWMLEGVKSDKHLDNGLEKKGSKSTNWFLSNQIIFQCPVNVTLPHFQVQQVLAMSLKNGKEKVTLDLKLT